MTPALQALDAIPNSLRVQIRGLDLIRAALAKAEESEREAAMWRAFNNEDLTYFKAELENRRIRLLALAAALRRAQGSRR